MVKAYPAIFHKDEDSYWAEFPDLPGCFTEGESIASAVVKASYALEAFLYSMMDRGMEFPTPSRVQDLSATGEDFVSVINAILPSACSR